MKKTKFISFKIGLFLLPLLFFNGVCNDDEGGGSSGASRNVTIKVNPGEKARWCDRSLVGDRGVDITIVVQEYDDNTGGYKNVTRREIDSNNSWDSGTYEYKLSLPNKPLRIFAQAFQGCSSCCTIGSNFCSEPASFAKNAALYFYGESTLETSQYGVTINIALLNCDCRGC